MKDKLKKAFSFIAELCFLITLTLLGKFDWGDLLLSEYQTVVTIFWVSGLATFMNAKKALLEESLDMLKDLLIAIIIVPLWYFISGERGINLFETWSVVIHFGLLVCIVLIARMVSKSIGKMAYISQMIIPIVAMILIKLEVEIVWAVVSAVILSHLISYCGYVNKNNRNTFRECCDDYLMRRKERYTDIALEVQNVINKSGYEECEASFELAKAWMLSNERLSWVTSLIEAGRELLRYCSDWILVMVSFGLGILTAKLSDDFTVIQSKVFWGWFAVIIVIGFPIDLIIKNLCNRIEKSYVTILKDMKYVEYDFLIKNKRDKEND